MLIKNVAVLSNLPQRQETAKKHIRFQCTVVCMQQLMGGLMIFLAAVPG